MRKEIGLKHAPSGEDSILFGKKGKDCVNSKKVLNKETGIVYDSALEAAKSINMKYEKLTDRLRGGVRNRTPLVYI